MPECWSCAIAHARRGVQLCEAVCCGGACPSTSTTSAVQSLRSRACSKCCALAMSRVAVVQQDALMVECGQFLRTGESVVSEVHPYEFVLREMHCTTHYNDRPRAHTYICLARASQAGWSRADFRARELRCMGLRQTFSA